MTEKRFDDVKGYVYDKKNCIGFIQDDYTCENIINLLNAQHEEIEELKRRFKRVIEQSRKNNELCVSDIRILEKALWCSGCENDYDRLRQLRREFLK